MDNSIVVVFLWTSTIRSTHTLYYGMRKAKFPRMAGTDILINLWWT